MNGNGSLEVMSVVLGAIGAQGLLLLLVAPVLEEFVLRAGVHQALCTAQQSWNQTKAQGLVGPAQGAPAAMGLGSVGGRVWLVAVLFGLIHLGRGPALVLATIPAGVAIGFLYERTRSWRMCAVAHSVMNAVWLGAGMMAPEFARSIAQTIN